jgi:hypothetical protein
MLTPSTSTRSNLQSGYVALAAWRSRAISPARASTTRRRRDAASTSPSIWSRPSGRETYERQLGRLRTDKSDRFEKLRAAEKATDDAAYLITAQRTLELARVAKSLWERRNREEQRDLLARVVCNPRLDGRTVRFDLKKPFAILAKMRGTDGWRPQRESNPR